MFRNNLKIAWRSLLKNKVTGFINIAGLAIGMAVTIMIGLWIHDELTYNNIHDNYDHLAQLLIHQTVSEKTRTGYAIAQPSAPALRENFGSDFEHVSMASWNYEHLITLGDKSLRPEGMHVQPEFPMMFSLEMLAGSQRDGLKDPDAILLSESLAIALFGKSSDDYRNLLGKSLRIDSRDDLKVTGIYRDLPRNSRLRNAKFYITWEHFLKHNDWARESTDNWGNHSYQLFAQKKENSDFATINEKIKDIEKEHNEVGKPELFFHPMSKWHLYSDFKNGENAGGRIQFVWLFGIIGVFVLLLACINFMNLSTARSEKRAKEVGIRKTIGSLRGQLIGQFLSESLLVSFLSMFLSIALVQISLDAFNEMANKSITMPWSEPVFWAALVGFVVVTGLLAGSYPAFYLSSFRPLKVLKGTFRSGRWSSVPRQVLVTLQFTVSVALIIGTIVVFQQIEHAKNRPVGYEREGMIQFFCSVELYDKYDLVRDNMIKAKGVEEFCWASSPLTNVWSNNTSFSWEGKDPEAQFSFGSVSVAPTFGKTVGWEVIAGRDFSEEFATDSASFVLNEAAVEQIGIPLDEIVGKTITWNKTPNKVIGVVRNLIMESPYTPIKPTIFFQNDNWLSVYVAKLTPGVPVQEALSNIEAVHKRLDPATPFEFEFVDEAYNEKFIGEERIGKLARVFAFLAIFISCLGLFGLSAYVAEQRTKEIGIRKVLGASVANLWAMQSKNFVVLVLLSCLIAAPIAWHYLDGWLADYEYRIDLSWKVFAWAGVLSLAVTLLTVSFQSVKAALANPVKSLRSE